MLTVKVSERTVIGQNHHLPCTRRKHSSSVDGRGRHKGMVWNNWLHYSNRLATDETYGNATATFYRGLNFQDFNDQVWPFAKVKVGNHSVSPWNTIDGIAETAKWIWANNTETTVNKK